MFQILTFPMTIQPSSERATVIRVTFWIHLGFFLRTEAGIYGVRMARILPGLY